MTNIFPELLKWSAISFISSGALSLLIGFKIVPFRMSTPEETEKWHKTYGQLMKLIGFFTLVIGAIILLIN